MRWNWQKKDWPHFKYDIKALEEYEHDFLYQSGLFLGSFKHINKEDEVILRINMMCDEAFKTSEIEGEYLNRDSLQSSIRKNFGLKTDRCRISSSEQGIAELMFDLYKNFSNPLTHETLWSWNSMILGGSQTYRSDDEPMQVVSGAVHNPKVHFEAPPSNSMMKEMDLFIKWFNSGHPCGDKPLPPLIRAGIAHLYFVSIHPFEDGNGRIARALAEKALSQCFGEASLIALSVIIEKHRKKYYDALEYSNKDLEINAWLKYFAETILEAQRYSQMMLEFLIKKTKFYERNSGELNLRQEKTINRIFEEGLEGFKGGLSAENYIAITKTSRATATRDLQDLVDKGILTQTGQLKSTRYYLNL